MFKKYWKLHAILKESANRVLFANFIAIFKTNEPSLTKGLCAQKWEQTWLLAQTDDEVGHTWDEIAMANFASLNTVSERQVQTSTTHTHKEKAEMEKTKQNITSQMNTLHRFFSLVRLTCTLVEYIFEL